MLVAQADKIRDLLFGNQMQDYDRRFSKLEERFLQRFKDIESETARNLSAFESNAKKQVESLAGQLREEKDLRADADKELERTFRENNQSMEKRLRSISDQLSQLEREMSDRLVQEALTNIVKHALAVKVRVFVGIAGSELVVEVQDDGVGFDTEASTSGFGLAGMRERVFLLGGTLEVTSDDGGTCMTTRIPLPATLPRSGPTRSVS